MVVVGGATMDLTSSPEPSRPLRRHTSNPGGVTQRPGGVGRNIAEAIARLLEEDLIRERATTAEIKD